MFHASRPTVGHDSIKVSTAIHSFRTMFQLLPLKLFSDIYDATTTYCENVRMKHLFPANLVVGDIMLAEANVVRHETARARGRASGAWKVHFHLLSVSKLASRVVVKEEHISNNFPLSL